MEEDFVFIELIVAVYVAFAIIVGSVSIIPFLLMAKKFKRKRHMIWGIIGGYLLPLMTTSIVFVIPEASFLSSFVFFAFFPLLTAIQVMYIKCVNVRLTRFRIGNLDDKRWEHRRRAIKVLSHTFKTWSFEENCETKSHVVSRLLKALHDEHEQVRKEVVIALGHSQDDRAIRPLMSVLQDERGLIRKEAAIALGRLNAPQAIPLLITALEDPYGSVRKAAVMALKNSQTIQTIPLLLKALSDDYDEVRKEAERALTSLCPLVQSIVFGDNCPRELYPDHTLLNPDVSNLTVPMVRLKEIVIDIESYDFYPVERFLTYSINYIGQRHLKHYVEVHIYGNQERLHPNFRNSFSHLCKGMTVHGMNEMLVPIPQGE